MPLLKRIAIILGLWLLAGIACSIFAEVTPEAGEDEAMAHLQLVFLTPLLAAVAITTAVVQDHHAIWQQGLVFWIVLAGFVTHAIVTLTRRDRRQFMVWVALQLVILCGSVACVIGYFRHLAEVGW